MRAWADENLHLTNDGTRFFVNPARPELQPIAHTRPQDETVDALLASGWKEVDESLYRIKLAGWRRFKDSDDHPRPAA